MSSRSPSADAAASASSASASSASARTATPTKSENGEEPTTRGHADAAKHHHVDPHGAGGHDDGETTPDGRGAAALASSESRDNLNDTISKTFGYMPPSSAEPVIAATDRSSAETLM